MVNIALYHGNFYLAAGGAEVYTLRAAKALMELGYSVDLYTSAIDDDTFRIACDNAGFCVSPKLIDIKTSNSIKSKVSKIFIDKHLLSSLWTINNYRNILKEVITRMNDLSKKYDLLVVFQSLISIYGGSIAPGDLVFFHYPDLLPGITLSIYIPESINPFIKLYKKFIMSMEYRLSRDFLNIAKIYKLATNSTWTKERLLKLNLPIIDHPPNTYIHQKFLGLLNEANVLYPPIEYEKYSSLYDPNIKKNLVLTVSRYAPEKNLWAIVYIASRVSNAHFVIAGTTRAIGSARILAQLESLIDKLKVKNITLEKDISNEKLIDLYSEAKVYLHPIIAEHFGITIAEGAAAGAVPIVYRDGGGWTDIASRIDSMLGYVSINEAVTVIRKLLDSNELWLKLSKKSVEVTSEFSWNNYKKRIDSVVYDTYKIKHGLTH